MYLEFFGLTRPPFARLSKPSEIFNSEQYSLLMSHLASATEQTDCEVVIYGADGIGKTSLLNRYTCTLGDEVSFATIDETCVDAKQFYTAFLRQLGFNDITGSMRELRSITREFLVHRCIAGDPVLMIIDNAHLVSPSVFEQLRWISETKVEGRRVLSVVLAGSSDLARVVDSPAMSSARFRSHVDFNIRACTEEETADYVMHRLKSAGDDNSVKFSSETHALIYRYSGGNPSVTNTLCNALLTEAHALGSRVITEDLVRTVADSSQLLPHVVPLSKKGRRKTDPEFKQKVPDQQTVEQISEREAPSNTPARKSSAGPTLPDADVKQLLEQVTMLSEQLGELRSDKKRALSDIDARDEDISELQQQVSSLLDQLGELRSEKKQAQTDIEARDKDVKELQQRFNAQAKDAEKLTRTVARNADEIDRLKKAASDSKKAIADAKKTLQKSEKAAEKASKKAVSDLKLANKRATEADALEKNNTALVQELEKKTDQLNSLDKSLGELEKRLQESEDECESLRANESVLRDLDVDERQQEFKAQVKETEKLTRTVARNADEIDRLKKAASDSKKAMADAKKALQKSEKASEKTVADLNVANQRATEANALEKNNTALVKEIEKKTDQLNSLDKSLGELEKRLQESEDERESLRASESALRDLDDNERQQKFEAQAKETEKLTRTVAGNADEIDRLKKAASENKKAIADARKALQKSEKAAEKAVADLKLADQRAADADALEKNNTALVKEIEKKTDQLNSLDKSLGKLEKRLQESEDERESLRTNEAALSELEESVTDKNARIASLQAELAGHIKEDTSTQALLDEQLDELKSSAARQDSAPSGSSAAVVRFEVVRDGKIEQILKVSECPSRIMIGRGEDSELCLNSKFVSRHHALIFCSSDDIHIQDLNSFNGTLVNFKKVSRCELRPDDNVVIGDYQIRPRQD